jgi:dTDP-4-amino-4,6-dideoxygalactose transaminase
MKIANEFNLFVIEDVAQALGADYYFSDGSSKKAGTIGTIGCTSFFPSKNLGCYGDGGAMYTQDETLAVKMKMIAHHGQSVQYVHDVLGVNSRLDSIQAAVLNVKLKKLNEYAAARNAAASFYDEALKGISEITTPFRVAYSNHVFHQYTVKLNGIDRKSLRDFLLERGVPTMIYYPIPLHMQKAYKSEKYQNEDFKITNVLCEQVLSLPMHTELNEEVLEYVTESIKSFLHR